ncbi:LLM class flavin-dependent oxidoreductase [Actinomadura madurae]|uniref:LLM class flavin-dependent oxidoreductase n=3 Tax=Actinomadura madurae TaxID=1993 RepID=UPI002025F0D7|nr:LLM class flavin-dependent oxidoreductase [Actinomadura madurae]MCP9955255.1 LLM class flavin-dependent oxidoreductase [Actinomadura madurae]MCP9971991.1 LLM class flavin-dependent oxidoreductase [Actinomadura madurae]URN00725.1 LLM class flavin-dependent oxidoreductase [Actinomadura madurae]URN02874.1 LLM class flavin-dependent oxidoreductase [Actinomadura madurae]
MRTGIVVTARPGVEELAVLAEELGFSSFWVYDTPMVNGDPFISLGLCAKATSRIKLGIGVTSPALRSSPAAAAAVASLNAIAPGRVICGIGTGNTARRTLGMLPTKMAELEAFTASMQDLTAGRETGYTEGDLARTIKFLHVGPYVNVTDPVEFVVAAFGAKAARIAGRRGAGVISFGLLAPEAWTAFDAARREAAREAGRPEEAESYVMTSLHLLGEGEDRHGDLARDKMGHIAMALLTFAADNPSFAGSLEPAETDAMRRLLERRGTAADDPGRHATLYRNYLGRIEPEDRDLIVPSLIDKLALVGTRPELRERIAGLEKAGIDEIVIQPVVDPEAEMRELAGLQA